MLCGGGLLRHVGASCQINDLSARERVEKEITTPQEVVADSGRRRPYYAVI